MMIASVFLPMLLCASPVANIAPGPEIAVSGQVRLGDIATISGLDSSARASLEERPVASMPPGRDRILVPRAGLADLVRRAVPGLSVEVIAGEPLVLLRARSAAEAKPLAGPCFRLVVPAGRGEIIGLEDVEATSCEAEPPAQVRYDSRAAVVRAARDLPAGASLGRLALSLRPDLERGDEASFLAEAGPVLITRGVKVLQDSGVKGRVFVRDGDGQVFAVPVAALRKEAGQ